MCVLCKLRINEKEKKAKKERTEGRKKEERRQVEKKRESNERRRYVFQGNVGKSEHMEGVTSLMMN